MILLTIWSRRIQTWLRGWLTPERIIMLDVLILGAGAVLLRALMPS